MDFLTAKAHALGVLFDTDYFTQSVIYTPNSGDSVTIPASILYGASNNTDGRRGDGQTWRLSVERDFRADFSHGGTQHIATVVVKAEDIPSPGYRDTIEIDGVTWTVKEIYNDA